MSATNFGSGLGSDFYIHRRLQRVLFFLTLCLVVLGGVVHNTGSSLACPDWPLCFGQVWPDMVGAVAIEHSHRLLASLVGFVNILLVVWAWKIRKVAPSLWAPSLFALGLVIVQGLFGGATVLLQIHPLVSTIHLGLSQLYLASLLWIGIRSSYVDQPKEGALGAGLMFWLNGAVGLLYFQMLLGALIRHTGFASACGLGTEAMIFCRDLLTQETIWWPDFAEGRLHILHRYLGVVMFFIVVGLVRIIWTKLTKQTSLNFLRKYLIWLMVAVVFQVLLGVATVASLIAILPVTLHLFGAALLWLLLLALNFHARCLRM